MAKEGYKPTAGMKSAAKRAIRWKEQGKATGAGTAVGWTRAGQLARGETLSLSTVKRMYSFFSRHEVDKKGKDFYNTSNPSNGRIMWDAWGGDAGFSWSRKIVEREKNMKKSLTQSELFEEIKERSEITKEQLGMVIEHLMEAIESMIEVPEEDEEEAETETEMPVEEASVQNPAPVGDPMKNEVNWPVTKAYENCGCETCKAKNISCEDCEECMSKSYESDNEEDDKWDNMAKSMLEWVYPKRHEGKEWTNGAKLCTSR